MSEIPGRCFQLAATREPLFSCLARRGRFALSLPRESRLEVPDHSFRLALTREVTSRDSRIFYTTSDQTKTSTSKERWLGRPCGRSRMRAFVLCLFVVCVHSNRPPPPQPTTTTPTMAATTGGDSLLYCGASELKFLRGVWSSLQVPWEMHCVVSLHQVTTTTSGTTA